MLNQCILIGRITSTSRNSEGVVDKLIMEVNAGTSTDYIMIDAPQKMASYGLFKEGSTIAVKARISSNNARDYQIVAERITVLGGSSDGS